MIKPSDPRQLAIDIMARSICSVQVGACIADSHGIVSWGWNSVGSGLGEHAEDAAIRRANRKRLKGATIYIASQRKRNSKRIYSRPCENCERLLRSAGVGMAYFTLDNGEWGAMFTERIL